MAGNHTLPRLWIPVFVIGNLFAFFWIVKALILIFNPSLSSLMFWKHKKTSAKEVSTGADAPEKESAYGVNKEGQVVRRLPTTSVPLIRLEWRDLCCSAPTTHGVKEILQGVYGVAVPGHMQALMGPSGAGKSTFMDMLVGRRSARNMYSGEIFVNGRPNPRKFLERSTYVPQEEQFVPTMRLEEVLAFYSSFMLPPGMPRKTKAARELEVMTMMGLQAQAKTLVGGVLPGGLLLRGLSGGERKRLGIAAGILGHPSLVFLDEPTTGLDSFAALNVMQHIRNMAHAGRTVVTSVHQPRTAIWNMFDEVLLLSQGLMMYQGPCEDMVPWFTDNLKFSYTPETDGTVSDWAMDLVSVNFGRTKGHVKCMTSKEDLIQAAQAFKRDYGARKAQIAADQAEDAAADEEERFEDADDVVRTNSNVYHDAKPNVSLTEQSNPVHNGKAVISTGQKRAFAKLNIGGGSSSMSNEGIGTKINRWIKHFTALTWRNYLDLTRNPGDVAGRMIVFTWVGAMAGVVFWNRSPTADQIVYHLQIAFGNLTMYMLIPFVFMSLFVEDKKYYIADQAARLYHPSSYYAAKVFATVPFNFIVALVYGLIVYGMAGLNPSATACVLYMVFSILMSLVANQVAALCATICPTQDQAFILFIAWTAVNLLINSYFLIYRLMHMYWLQYFKYISAVYYAWQGIVLVDLRDQHFNCSRNAGFESFGFPTEYLPNTPNLSFFASVLSNLGANCTANPEAVFRYYSIRMGVGELIGILVAYWAIVNILTYIVLVFKSRKLRGY